MSAVISGRDAARSKRIPPLQAGDRLTADEFERRYEAMPHIKKAELIEGVVYMGSPVTIDDHASPHFRLGTWLGVFEINTPIVEGGDNGSIRLDTGNMPQPDLFLRIIAASLGQSHIGENGYLLAPEWIGEVSASTTSRDLHDKFEAYRRNGVLEYVVWRVFDEAIDWFILRQGQYEPLPLSPEGYFKSEVFPGLWLDPAEMVRRDMKRVMEVLQQGINNPEHLAFVEKLKAKTEK